MQNIYNGINEFLFNMNEIKSVTIWESDSTKHAMPKQRADSELHSMPVIPASILPLTTNLAPKGMPVNEDVLNIIKQHQ